MWVSDELMSSILLYCVLVFLLACAVRAVGLRGRWPIAHRRRCGLCVSCGYDLTGNVSGRCPECGFDRLAGIVVRIRERETANRWKAIGAVIGGLILLPVGPLVVASIFRYVTFRSRLPWGVLSEWSWRELFILMLVVMIPLLFLLEWRTKGRYGEEGVDQLVDVGRGGFATPGFLVFPYSAAATTINFRTIATIFTGFFLLGPRAMLFGYQKLRLGKRLGEVDRETAGRVLMRLAGVEGGMETSGLFGDGVSEDTRKRVLVYLAFHGWIGVGDKWQRAWLWSSVRESLGRGPKQSEEWHTP